MAACITLNTQLYYLNYHVYADDTQLYLSFNSSQQHANSAIATLELCINEIRQWMKSNFLKLNDKKWNLCFLVLTNNFPKSTLIVFTLVTLQLLQHPRLGIWELFLILPWPWNHTSPMSPALQHFNYETSAGFANTLAVMPLNKLSILL